MSQPTQHDNALAFAQSLIDFANQANSLLDMAQVIQSEQASKGYMANLQAMATYSVNEDGTQGTTDGTPTSGHPIVGLNVTEYSLDVLRTSVVDDYVTFLTGSGAATQTDRRPYIAALLP